MRSVLVQRRFYQDAGAGSGESKFKNTSRPLSRILCFYYDISKGRQRREHQG
jgi:hypothetical protein